MRTLKLTKETIQNILTDLLKRSPNNYTSMKAVSMRSLQMSAQTVIQRFLTIQRNLTVQP